MKAIILTEYGPPEVLRLAEVAKPTPKDHEVLIRVRATSINFGDTLVRNLKRVTPRTFSMPLPLWLPTRLYFGFGRPKQPILGSDFAGEVEAVGQAVTRFRPGDAVFGYLGPRMGANAEYLCLAADGLVAPKPANMTFEQAATIPYGALTALNVLRKTGLQPGQKILINGASGSIGSHAVQLARHMGAQVTGVCGPPRLALVQALGATEVIDYTREDFTQRAQTYDVILDITGKSSFARCRRVLTPDGRLVLVSFKTRHFLQMLATARSRQKVICALSSETLADLLHITELVEAGHLRAIIDRCYPLEQTAEAHRYVEQGQKQGQVVISLAPQPAA